MSKSTPHIDHGLKAMHKLISRATKEESKILIPILRRIVMESANDLEFCPFCSQPIKDTVVTFTQETAKDAIRILLNWTRDNNRNEFKTSEIKHLLTHTQSDGSVDDLPNTTDLIDEDGHYSQPALARSYPDA